MTGLAGGGSAVISALGGTLGVGTTALAIHGAAHRLLPRFPDGHLYADLRGYACGQALLPAGAATATIETPAAAQPSAHKRMIGALPTEPSAGKSAVPSRRSEIVRTNNNAPLVTLCNCEERCRLQTSAQEDQRIRALSRTPLGDDGLTPPLGKPERFGDSDIRGIGDSQRKVLIRIHQVGDPRIIGARQVDGSKVSISQRRAGRLLIVSLLLPGQARQGSG